jgi:AcrR family transcriptional regulator
VSARENDGRPGYGDGRAALIAAAVRVVGERGLRGLTYRAVAQEAGVTHGLVAHHFGSRDALLRATVLASAARSAERTGLERETGDLSGFASELGSVIEADDAPFRFELELALDSRRQPEIGDAIRDTYAMYIAAARRELVRAGFDEEDEALARVVFAALDGLIVQQLLHGRADDTDSAVRRLQRLLEDARRGARADEGIGATGDAGTSADAAAD